MPSPAERPKIKARDVVEGEVRAGPDLLLNATTISRAIDALAHVLLASLRTTHRQTFSHAPSPERPRLTALKGYQDPAIEGLDLSQRVEGQTLKTLREWITEVLETVQSERKELSGSNGLDESVIPPDFNLPPEALKGTITSITKGGTTVAAKDGHSYFIPNNGLPMGQRIPGQTQIWILATGERNGPKPDARFICRVGEEPRGSNGDSPRGQIAQRGHPFADVPRESRV